MGSGFPVLFSLFFLGLESTCSGDSPTQPVQLDPALWRYDGLAGPFHPSYIAAYLTMGMFLMPAKSRLRIPFLVVAALFVGLLASKAGWLVAILVLGAMLVSCRIRSARWDGIVLLSAGMLFIGAILGDQGRMQEFMRYATQSSLLGSDDVEAEHGLFQDSLSMTEAVPQLKKRRVGSSGGRMQAWRASWDLLKDHPEGVGTGDVVQELVRVYEAQDSDYALLKRMNPHSAYWQALVTLGWLGGRIVAPVVGRFNAGVVETKVVELGRFRCHYHVPWLF